MAMAKAECRCATCGKDFFATKRSYNRRDADSWENWAVKNMTECQECRNARIARERAEAAVMAAEDAQELGLPDLEGSEKQIAWAMQIRKRALDKLNDALEEMLPMLAADEVDRETVDRCRSFINWISEKNKAKWWIEEARNIPFSGFQGISRPVSEEFVAYFSAKED